MKKIEKMINSGKVRVIASIMGALILALLIFHAGIVVGSRHDLFGRHDMNHGFSFPFLLGDFMPSYGFIQNNHGSVGTIIAVTPTMLSIKTRAGTNRTILISTSTVIRGDNDVGITSLAAGDQIVVLGEPDSQDRLDAHFIHILFASTTQPTP